VEVVKQGKEAIKRYFERIKKEKGEEFIYEAKLTLVGDGSAGKTSLQVRLMNKNASLPKKETRTRGIEIKDWDMADSPRSLFKKYLGNDGSKQIAHIWDFGGQDVYFPVHRFFLTENSVFVLLASTRVPQHNFEYWIPTIYQFGGKSPIILGQTCHEGNKVSWNDIGIYLGNSNFNIIRAQDPPYYQLNLPEENEGLDTLEQVIKEQITKLPHFGKGVPPSWKQARAAIAEERKIHACITFVKFREMCNEVNPEQFVRKEDFEDFANFLHQLGVILWYNKIEELKQWVVLQPEWALNAVYKIIDDPDVQETGIIKQHDFGRIWEDRLYDDKHLILKKMLEVFKIAFPKKHNRQDYILPARMKSMPVEMKWKRDESCLRLEYKYEFMPKGLVNQLSAQMSRHIQDNSVWNNAVNLSNEKATAQVEEDFYNRKITIRAKGKDARGLNMQIMAELDVIINEYRGVKPEIIVPCTCKKCLNSNDPTSFKYDKLIEWSETKETVTCNESDEKLSIDSLLFEVGLPNPTKEKRENRNGRKPLKSFISYSKFDGEETTGVNYLEEFKSCLTPLTSYNNLISTWDDTLLIAGENWDNKIKEELNTADVIFVLMSNDLLKTKYVKETELKIAFEREANGECIVVPVIVRDCGWADIAWLGKNNAIPRKGHTISSWQGKFQSKDEAWTHVYTEVKKMVESFTR